MAVSGSIDSVRINGLLLNAAADGNFEKTPKLEKEAIPHSGGNMIKHTRASAQVESGKLIVTAIEYEIIQGFADLLDPFAMSYTMADGSSYHSEGEIMLGNLTSEDLACEITMIPTTGVWELFAA